MGAGASSTSSSGQLAMKIAQKFSLKQENFLHFPHEFHQNPSLSLTHHFRIEKNPLSKKIIEKKEDEKNEELKDYYIIPFYDKIYIELIEKYYYNKENKNLLNFNNLNYNNYNTEYININDIYHVNENGWTILHSFCLPGISGIKNSFIFNEFIEDYVSNNIIEENLTEYFNKYLLDNINNLIKNNIYDIENNEKIYEEIIKFDENLIKNENYLINIQDNNIIKLLKEFLIKENISLYNYKDNKILKKYLLFLNNYIKKLFNKDELLLNNFHYEGTYTIIEEYNKDYNNLLKNKVENDQNIESFLNKKTIRGPGTFHYGWTPLHMASAYNLADIARKLLEYEEVDVNIPTDDYYYTPLYEACHRNYHEIVKLILDTNRVDLYYIPPYLEESNSNTPPRLPPQSYLAEASRYGHYETVKLLLDAGAPIDLTNDLGWTALHEAAFHGYSNVVKLLLDKGANPFLINSQGLYPYHLTNNKEILEMLPSKNVNDPEDIETPQVDTLDVLMGLALLDLETATAMRSQSENRGLDFSLSYNVEKNSNSIYDNFFIDEYVYEGMGYNTENFHTGEEILIHPTMIRSLSSRGIALNEESLSSKNNSLNKSINNKTTSNSLASLSSMPPLVPDKNFNNNSNIAENEQKKSLNNTITNSNLATIISSLKPEQIPEKFLCQLTKKIMTTPLKSLYGHTFEEKSIKLWFKFNGRICPITGCPLSESDLTPLPTLASQIKQFLIKIHLETNIKEKKEDDLYDF